MGWDIDRFPDKDSIEKEDIFKCSICEDVLQDPRQTPCEHSFCKECIEHWLNLGNRNCPIDREPVNLNSLRAESRKTRQLLDRLIIRCKHYPDGCRMMSKLEDMPHLHQHEQNNCRASQQNVIRQLEDEFQRKEREYKKKISELEGALKTSEDNSDSKDTRLTELNNLAQQMTENIEQTEARIKGYLSRISELEKVSLKAVENTKKLKKKTEEMVQIQNSTIDALGINLSITEGNESAILELGATNAAIDDQGTKILIAGGYNNNTSYILEVYFNHTTITKIDYKDLPNVPHTFYNATFGSYQGRSVIISGANSDGQCIEFDQEEYQVIPSLNINREWAASTFIQNKVVVAGGYRNDSIETLDWDESNHGSQWIQSPSKMPVKAQCHTLVTFDNNLFMIGGYDGSNSLDTIWEGSVEKENNKITWVEMGLRLQKKRYRHFSFVISNQIIIFGGYDVDDDFVEILQGNNLKQGPKVPFKLGTCYDQAVLDRKNRIIITSKDHGLIVYDHQKGIFTNYDNFKLREYRTEYAAILQ